MVVGPIMQLYFRQTEYDLYSNAANHYNLVFYILRKLFGKSLQDDVQTKKALTYSSRCKAKTEQIKKPLF